MWGAGGVRDEAGRSQCQTKSRNYKYHIIQQLLLFGEVAGYLHSDIIMGQAQETGLAGPVRIFV